MGRKRSGMVGRPRRPSGLKWLGGWSGARSEPRRAGKTSRPGRPVSSPQRGLQEGRTTEQETASGRGLLGPSGVMSTWASRKPLVLFSMTERKRQVT